MDLADKTAFAAYEAAQERAAYEAKQARDDALAATSTWKPTRWELARLRDGKATRDAAPATTDEGRAEDAWLDAMLAHAEATYAAQGAAVDTTQQAGELLSGPLFPGTGNGASSYRADGPTEAQLRFLASLGRSLGRDLGTPADKRDASRVIDAAKAELAAARRAGTAPAPAARPARPATDRQVEYLADLLTTRALPDGFTVPELAGLTFDAARTALDVLTAAPRARTAAHGIREGRYAYQPADAQAMFLRVDRTGRIWVQAGPAEHPYRGQGTEALAWVKANMREAAALYGQLLGSCGRCGRELTDADSRARGLGPICAKAGW